MDNFATVDGSTTIAAGGTAQNLFSGNTPANGFAVYNPDASEALWVSDSATAAANATGSIYIAPLGGYETPSRGCRPLGPVSVIGATTGHKITARTW
jgi:hypothetical protein